MREILTPVQFEPALEILNLINKLSISQKVSLSLDVMQACQNPVGHGNPIIGKFCKEDKNGALAVHEVVRKLTNTEEKFLGMVSLPTWGSVTFSQKVYGVQVISFVYIPATDWNFWCTPNREIIQILPFFEMVWLPFEGETIWFSAKDDITRGSVLMWGVY